MAYCNLGATVVGTSVDDQFVDKILRTIGVGLVRFKSIELDLVGQSIDQRGIFKQEQSIDGEVRFVHEPLPKVLPGEVPSLVKDFTTLSDPGTGLCFPRDTPATIELLKRVRLDAVRVRSQRNGRPTWVVWSAWGLTRLAYVSASGGLEESWFLRDRTGANGGFVPILRLSAHFQPEPNDELGLSIFTESHCFSLVEPASDAAHSAWKRKADARAPLRNAELLADGFGDFLKLLPGARFMWETDQEGAPDLLGAIPAEFGRRWGPPGRFANV